MPTMRLDLDAYLSLPRLTGLACSPDGTRLVTAAALPHPDGTRFVSALWELDPRGERPPRRLTRSEQGEAGPVFTASGDLLFTSTRPAPDTKEEDQPTPRLWSLPGGGGEAALLAAPPGGVSGCVAAAETDRVLLLAPVQPGAGTWDEDREHEQARKDAGASAQLITEYPMRRWDRWVATRQQRLHAATVGAGATEAAWHDCTPQPGRAFEDAQLAVSADGRWVATTWWRDVADPRELVTDLVLLELDDAGEVTERRTLLAGDSRIAFGAPAFSPDGCRIACLRHDYGVPERAGDFALVLVDIVDGTETVLAADLDRWPQGPVWAPDGSAVLFTADDGGHTLPFRVDVASGVVTRLAASGAYTDLVCAPDGSAVYGLRSHVDAAPAVVALDPSVGDQDPRVLHAPAAVELPGVVERVEAAADDGTPIASWLVLPHKGEGPFPLVVFIHGGPFNSWSGWHWRWNPHLLAARGWAVLCPDPSPSTGYGQELVQRGWGRWGAEPYTDLMAAVDAAIAREDIDKDRTAAMGGSFGGYMTNWVAGQTDRFRALITHASLWSLEAFHGTTDLGVWWEREFGDPYLDASRYAEWSPRRHVGSIRTPMLVIHGERDFRVPVSEGLTLWTDLRRHGVEAAYLHFPDEHHWITKPGNVRVWYEAVFAWLDHHVLGEPFARPPLL